MAYYRYDIVSIDGDTALSTNSAGDYNLYFDGPEGDPLGSYPLNPVAAEIVREHPIYQRSQPQAKTIPITVELRDTDHAKLNTLKRKLRNTNDRVHKMILQDGSAANWEIKFITLALIREEPARFTLVAYVNKPILNAVVETNVSQAITASPQNFTVTNDGNIELRPITIIKPTSYKLAANAKSKFRYSIVVNRSARDLKDASGNPYPIDITNGGWDVETKIKAGELHPQGYDISVFDNGREINRYLSNYGAGGGLMTNAPSAGAELQTFHDGAAAWHAQRLVLPGCSERETNTVDEVQLPLMRNVAGPTGNIRIKIYDDNNGVPGAVIPNGTSDNIDVTTIDIGTVETVSFVWSGTKPVLNAKTQYWIAIDPTGITGTHSNTSRVDAGSHTNSYEGQYGFSHSADGTTWTAPATATGGHAGTGIFRNICFRVFVTGTAKIWVPMKIVSSLGLELLYGVQTAENRFFIAGEDGNARLPDRCAVLIGNPTDGYEVVIMCAKADHRSMISSKRGARGTTALVHKAGNKVYLIDHDVKLAFNHQSLPTLLKSLFEPDELAPVIDGVNSTNAQMKWLGPYISPGSENRSMRWRTQQDDSEELYETISLDADPTNDLSIVTFKDKTPEGAFIGANVIFQDFPTGIKAAASAITVDEVTIGASLEIEHIGYNARGEKSVLATHRISDQGAGKTLTPTDELYRYRIRINNGVITGAEASGGADLPITASSPKAQTFTLENDVEIIAAGFKIKETTGTPPVNNLSIDLYEVNDDDAESINTSVKLMPTQTVTPSDTTASYATIVKTLATRIKLAAGKYAFVFTTAEATNGYSLQASDGSVYAGGECRTGGQITIEISDDYDADTDSTTLDEASTTVEVSEATPAKRAAIRFPLSSLPSGADVTAALLRLNIASANLNVAPHCYSYALDDGQTDPDADSAAQMHGNISNGTDLGTFSAWSATGNKELVLSSSAHSQIESAKAAVGRYSLGLRDLTAGSNIATFSSVRHASDPEPKLVVTYTPAAATAFTTQLGQDAWFRIYGTPTQTDTLSNSGDTATIDNPIIVLDDVTPGTPYVSLQSSDQDLYLLDCWLENLSTFEPSGVYVDEAVDASESLIDVTDARPFLDTLVNNKVVRVDDELWNVFVGTEGTPDTISVTRGYAGSTGVPHDAGDEVMLVNQRVRIIALMQVNEELSVNWDTLEVLHSDDDLAQPEHPVALYEIYELDPYKLDPGANKIQYQETGVVAVTVQHRFRSTVQ